MVQSHWHIAGICLLVLNSSLGWPLETSFTAGAESTILAAETPAKVAVPTIQEAKTVSDLSGFPLIDPVEKTNRRPSFFLGYDSATGAEKAYNFHKAQFEKAGWKAEPGETILAEMCSGTFKKKGYLVSVSVIPVGTKVRVSANCHGNLPLDKLPHPEGCQPISVTPIQAMYLAPGDVATTEDVMGKLLAKHGWEPYGVAGPIRTFAQNGSLLTMMITAAPAQQGKTMLMLSSALRSVELPTSTAAEKVQYSDQLTQVNWESTKEPAEVIAEMREKLLKQGWKATTENPILIDFKLTTIFRSADKGMRILEVRDLKPGSRCELKEFFPSEVPEEGATPKSK